MSRPSSVYTPRGSRDKSKGASVTEAKDVEPKSAAAGSQDVAPKSEVAALPTPQRPSSRNHSRQPVVSKVEPSVAPSRGPMARSKSRETLVPSKAAREESPDSPSPRPAPREDNWEVVGGDLTNGILVRTDIGLSSPANPTRLAKGAIVKALEINGNRMMYRRISGAGPVMGWVSIKTQDKPLLKQVEAGPKDDVDTKDTKVQTRRAASLPGKKRISFHYEDHLIELDSEDDKQDEKEKEKEKEKKKERHRDTSPCEETSPETTPKMTPTSDTKFDSFVETGSPIISPDTVGKLANFFRSDSTSGKSTSDADASDEAESDVGGLIMTDDEAPDDGLQMTDDEEDAGDAPCKKARDAGAFRRGVLAKRNRPQKDGEVAPKEPCKHRASMCMNRASTDVGRAWDFPLANPEKRELLALQIAAGERAQRELALLSAAEADEEACAPSRVEAKPATTKTGLARQGSSKSRFRHAGGIKKNGPKGRLSSSRKPHRKGGNNQPADEPEDFIVIEA